MSQHIILHNQLILQIYASYVPIKTQYKYGVFL